MFDLERSTLSIDETEKSKRTKIFFKMKNIFVVGQRHEQHPAPARGGDRGEEQQRAGKPGQTECDPTHPPCLEISTCIY